MKDTFEPDREPYKVKTVARRRHLVIEPDGRLIESVWTTVEEAEAAIKHLNRAYRLGYRAALMERA